MKVPNKHVGLVNSSHIDKINLSKYISNTFVIHTYVLPI